MAEHLKGLVAESSKLRTFRITINHHKEERKVEQNIKSQIW